ncbi:hypothetical protein [Streptomyces qinzhouensis]|uniref:hypothetical protein n=1 Tax=Streptomyces qinzhouensis TaxID=2599401 RepID=UPI0016445F32|nr:hypothetical protein [Streptomyces qinzhouensis]
MSRRRFRRVIGKLVRLYLDACTANAGHGRVHLGADAFGPQPSARRIAQHRQGRDGER